MASSEYADDFALEDAQLQSKLGDEEKQMENGRKSTGARPAAADAAHAAAFTSAAAPHTSHAAQSPSAFITPPPEWSPVAPASHSAHDPSDADSAAPESERVESGADALSREDQQTIRECKRSIREDPNFVEPYVSCNADERWPLRK